MALDLGISPHAVEKRLKMARTKLGLSSSLAAARLLAEAEGYQILVPQPPDLFSGAGQGKGAAAAASPIGADARRHRKGSIMFAALLLMAIVQDVPAPATDQPVMKNEKGDDVTARKVGLDEAAAFDREGFRQKDLDHSGFLDPREASSMEPRDAGRDANLPPAPVTGSRDPAAERKWMAKLDNDRDGRVSETEYVDYMLPWTLGGGVPAEWHPAAVVKN
ncbi:EF-hand domain-containing protein [Sphingomonas sp. KR1UV-12]|uniref:EF-hand domain-containing protein n=1 Tax=Sphingomonas aurea TaxID=3063994 RepID=A0ABT9EHH7_9SPHN|nr:EF-hand domain-containing protein [Sphingomonas sp. KR1UV-12]MDP1026430.1 EF-hand domain-containing protein [Sphingomonas sp. KR1UV-12]